MLSEKMQAALNSQINAELYSAYLYLSASAYFQEKNLPGFANWMNVQAQEEQFHAMKFYHFVLERLGKVSLQPVAGPPTEWASPLAVFQEAFQHEQKVTSLINNLVSLAAEERDYAAHSFLQWFVDEQVEEESNADAIVQQLKLAGDSGTGLLILDRELGARTYTPPAASGDAT